MRAKTPYKKQELIDLINQYGEYWQEWTASGTCFLKQNEITVINNFLSSGSHGASCLELSISPSTASAILKRAKSRLRFGYAKYEIWIIYKLNKISGVFKDTTEPERFLSLPFECLEIDYFLKRKLYTLQINTFRELIESYSLKDLKRMKGWGDKTITILKRLLEKNNCLHLLNKGVR